MRGHLMNRAFDVIANQCSVCSNPGLVALVHGIKCLTRAQHAPLDQLAEGDARQGAFANH